MSKFSVVNTIFWMVFLTVGIQSTAAFIVQAAIFSSLIQVSNVEMAFLQPHIILLTLSISCLFVIPLFKYSSHQTTESFPYTFLGLENIKKNHILTSVISGSAYYITELLIRTLFDITTGRFLFNLRSQIIDFWDVILLALAVCVLAPVVEELIFRGLAYTRLKRSALGIKGAIIIPGVLFAFLHYQYDGVGTYALLILASLFLGYLRYKTGNTYCCIIIHSIINALSLIELTIL